MRLAETIIQLNEYAATPSAISQYIGKRSGRTYYLRHRTDSDMVHCSAHLAADNAFEPLRQKIAVTSCSIVGNQYDPSRNNISVYPNKSFVEPQCRRDGVLEAMYDHLTLYGFVVYPADGSIGHPSLQAQSDDAKGFWAKRGNRTGATKLKPASEADANGWNNPFVNADIVCGKPVIAKLKMDGRDKPALILWQKDFTSGRQSVGVTMSEHGYRVALIVQSLKHNETYSETVFINDGAISYYYKFLDKMVKSGTVKVMLAVDRMLDVEKNRLLDIRYAE
jgi:hypothetical protein